MAERPHGRAGLQALPGHARLARAFARWVDADPNWERLAPVPFSTVCFRLRPQGWATDDPRLNPLNQRLLDAVNATGAVSLSHAVLPGVAESPAARYTLRLAIRQLRTEERHVREAWEILRAEALRLGATPPLIA
jgi:aromatic-L-amino-acid/L-tryptophan decarboxylase